MKQRQDNRSLLSLLAFREAIANLCQTEIDKHIATYEPSSRMMSQPRLQGIDQQIHLQLMALSFHFSLTNGGSLGEAISPRHNL
jgi:hypothetical protein